MPTTIGFDKYSINHDLLLDLPFREATGALTQDIAKPHHPVTLINTPTWSTLTNGLGYITLNGVNEHLQSLAADTTDLDFTTGDYSLGGWVYFTVGGADDKTPICRFLLDNDGWELYHYMNEILTLRHHHSAGATARTGCYSSNWSFATWWCMGVSRSGTAAQFYRNGLALSTTCSTGGLIDPETCAQNLYLGTDTTTTNYHNGSMWNMRVWSRALAPEEWKTIFETERYLFNV